ncbi:hypothetical protein E2C01_002719 [Portunus trituberculatus]|uniref:Uncharacterized protein n=1 Tax=Portunus trituberculatus TaxID=210409 RepID=A0A5B7CMN5_PORTR|nr:hypothetical protein [Portunus trituberculatus]
MKVACGSSPPLSYLPLFSALLAPSDFRSPPTDSMYDTLPPAGHVSIWTALQPHRFGTKRICYYAVNSTSPNPNASFRHVCPCSLGRGEEKRRTEEGGIEQKRTEREGGMEEQRRNDGEGA